MGAPIQTKMFKAFGMAPTVIAYAEVYNAIQTGVIDAAENEAAGIQQMKFYEVGPNIALTAHAMKGDRERCHDAGMDGYVSKPVKRKTLFGEIERVLNS